MSESSSGVNTSSNSFSKSYSSHCSDLSETNTCLPVLSKTRRIQQQRCDSGISSPLPCDAFKYLTWHKLKEHDVQGTQIRCPRVREGPPNNELVIRGETHLLQEDKQLTDKEIWRQRLQENWENCVRRCNQNLLIKCTYLHHKMQEIAVLFLQFKESELSLNPKVSTSGFPDFLDNSKIISENLNLSYQGLGDQYQQNNLYRILRRLIRVERLWLVDNELKDLSAIRLPRCKELNLSRNYFTTFKQLPKLPAIQHLSLAENNIETLSGLSDLKHSPLESLILKSNPCEFQEDYRLRVFSALPNLRTLDGIPKLPEDWSTAEESHFLSSKCTIL